MARSNGGNTTIARNGRGIRNRILRALTDEEYERLAPHLRETPLEFKEVLYEQDERITSVYFVEDGVASLVTIMHEGEIETGTVGNEGMVGIHGFLGADRATDRAICQVPGRALEMSLETLRREPPDSLLHQHLMRYAEAVMAMLAQSAACNRAHTIEQRMCRWLLMTMDRVGRDEFPLTQEFLAQMLGVRRPSVSLAGAALQRAGLLRYSRGRITILNRRALEATSCECYERIHRAFQRAVGSGNDNNRNNARNHKNNARSRAKNHARGDTA